MEDIFFSIGDNIRIIREDLKVSRRCVAKDLNLSSQYLGEIERGEANPTLKVLLMLADYYKISLAELMGESIFASKYKPYDTLKITKKQREAIENLINIFKK